MRKTIEEIVDLSIAEILGSMKELDSLTIHEMLNRKVKSEKETSRREGYEQAKAELKKEYGVWSAISDNVGYTLVFALIIGVFGGVYLLFHNINAKKDALDTSEMAACSAGDYKGCIDGWTRNVDSENRDTKRAYSYEQTYFHATNQLLITNSDHRFFEPNK